MRHGGERGYEWCIRQKVLPSPPSEDRETASWHGQWFACSTVARAGSPHENRPLTTNRNIPNAVGILASSGAGGCQRYVEVRGEVEKMPEEGALEFSDRQVRRYWGVDEYPFERDTPQVLFHGRPARVVVPTVGSPVRDPSGTASEGITPYVTRDGRAL